MKSRDVLSKTDPAPPDPETRRPPRYWLVGLGLLGVVAVMLGAAFYLDSQLRPRVGNVSSPAAESIATAAAAPSATPVPSPTAIVSAMAQATPNVTATTGTPRSSAASTPTAVATIAPGVRLADPTLPREVEQAYLKYWEVYSDALLSLDASRVADVAADEELRRIREEVREFRQRNTAVRVRVAHSYGVFDVKEAEAKVIDRVLNRSFAVDPITKQPSERDVEGKYVEDVYLLRKMNGVWKVVESLRQEG